MKRFFISLLLLYASHAWIPSTPPPQPSVRHAATVAPVDGEAVLQDDNENDVQAAVLQAITQNCPAAVAYAQEFGLAHSDAGWFALFAALRQAAPLDFKGQPILLRAADVQKALRDDIRWPAAGYFDMTALAQALEDDFLDAARGSTDTRKGWQITDVSVPRGDSFEEARMTFADVQAALDKGTVIFNAAGAHIPTLAVPTLCCTDATALPAALNLYVTAADRRTSAPPHTDKQDVVVMQRTGAKHWRVYRPPAPKPHADPYARGKGDDALPLHTLAADDLLLETVLTPGDVLFIPAAFPHTTSTVLNNMVDHHQDTSIHLTVNMDHHIWELDYLSARRLALRRAGVADTALGKQADGENYYTGACNLLTDTNLRNDLFSPLPLGLLQDDGDALVDDVTHELERISRAVDAETYQAVPSTVWKETVMRLQQQGRELWDTHRDMYLAALEEGRTREAEAAMTAHLKEKRVLTPERMQRLSLFRVKRYYDQINAAKESLKEWSYAGAQASTSGPAALPPDWAFTLPVKVGDHVEADLGGALFPATVSRASGGTYDVQFFDGDRETNLQRSQIKLSAPPATPSTTGSGSDEVDTSKMTPKQLKRWKKQQQKLKKQ